MTKFNKLFEQVMDAAAGAPEADKGIRIIAKLPAFDSVYRKDIVKGKTDWYKRFQHVLTVGKSWRGSNILKGFPYVGATLKVLENSITDPNTTKAIVLIPDKNLTDNTIDPALKTQLIELSQECGVERMVTTVDVL